jgi:hypothetical protein
MGFRVHTHRSYIAEQAAYLASQGRVESFGTADFQYDASAGRYFTPASLASGGTTTAWTSKLSTGVVVPTSGFGPTYGGGTYSLPNFYYVGTNAQNPVVATFTASIAVGTASTFTGTVAQTSGNAATATLTVTSAPSNGGVAIGYLVTGGTLPTGTYILANQSGTANTTGAWTVTVPQGTTIPTNATSATYTCTPITMTVTAVASGIINVGGMVYKSSGGPTANTFVTAQGTGTGGTGTYFVNISQTYASTSAVTQFMPFVGFNSGDAFRVPMSGGDRTTSGYTVLIAYKWGVATGTVSMMGSTHGNGGDYSWTNSAGTRTYNVAGATATGGSVSATGWHVTALRFDGTQADNATRFKAWYDGTAESLTFSGTVGTATTAPATITSTVTAASASGTAITLTYVTTGSPAYVVGDSITVAGLSPTTTSTSALVNGTFTVTACTATTVTYAVAGTYTRTSGGTVTGVPIPNLMVAGKAPIASATKNTNPVTTTQGINIGEMLVYSSALSDSQITALTTYLKNKWLGTN